MEPKLRHYFLTQLRNKLLLLIAGILSVAAGWDMPRWPGGILVVGGAITLLFTLLKIMGLLSAWHELKKKAREEESGILEPDSYITWPSWFNRGAGLVIHILLFAGITFGAARHENDFGGNKFVFHSFLAGLIFGYILFRILLLFFDSWNEHKNKRIEIAFYIILLTIFLSLSLGPFVNQFWAGKKTECATYQMKVSKRSRNSGSKYVHIHIGNRTERFNPPYSLLHQLGPHDSLLTLCVKTGFFGYKYVDEFRLPEKKTPDEISK